MRVGVTFPQIEITADPAAIRAYALAAEQLGYSHILSFEHVIGADLTHRPDWKGPYNLQSQFHEPFVLYGYLAALTHRIELVTGVLILPQRQTVLVAKQAAEVDVLSGGRLRLGIGIGWNEVEYQALGQDFHNRGRRSEEQIDVLRLLLSQESVTFHGRWHDIPAAGINPMPVRRPIPIWIGGSVEQTVRRVVDQADGWIITMQPGDKLHHLLDELRRYASERNRDLSTIGVEGRINIANQSPDDWARAIETWRALGATHVAVNTMNAGLRGADAHIDAISRFMDVVSSLV